MKSNPKGRQSINCSVGSCTYNHESKSCDLEDIMVSATPYGSTGKACDESMCSSYRTKG